MVTKRKHIAQRFTHQRWEWRTASGLCAETGEVADKIAKYYRGDGGLDEQGLKKELGDVLWFIAELSTHLGFNLSEVAQFKSYQTS